METPLRTWLAILLVVVLAPLDPACAADTLSAQRRAFIAAEQALAAADRDTFEELAARLSSYPLHPYLHLADLMGRLDTASEQEVLVFIERYRGTAPGERLRLNWLKHLARERRWQDYVDAYVDNDSETRECLYRRGLYRTGRANAAFDGLDALYLTGSSLPDACDPLFSAWSESGRLSADLVWQRIDLALERGNTGVARFQRRYLPTDQQPWAEQLLLHPATPTELANLLLPDDTQQRVAVVLRGIARLARRDPRAAAEFQRQLQDQVQLPEFARDRINAAIGQALARQGDAAGLVYLRRIQARDDNIELQHQRLRAALRLTAWADLAYWVDALPSTADEDGEWHYWLARALARQGDMVGAAHAFADASKARSFWGFRAAELIGRPPALAHRPAPVDAEWLDVLLTSDTTARIRELQFLGRDVDVKREWRELTRDMTRPELVTAAALGARLGLVTESIFTLARSDYWDDLDLRFPLLHRDLIVSTAKAQGLPADWVYAVIRQESAFDAGIASHAGAVGLMQLMPATAAEVARDAGLEAPSTSALTDPRLNLELGSRYLAAMRRRFGGDALLATAAYNAGPNAVRRWLPVQPMAADLWMSEIPYRETRDYVRRVLTYRVIYADKLGREGFRLGGLLRPVSISAQEPEPEPEPDPDPGPDPEPELASKRPQDQPADSGTRRAVAAD